MMGVGKSRARAAVVSKKMEFEFGKMHCSGINGGNDADGNGINAGAGGRRSTGYMEGWRCDIAEFTQLGHYTISFRPEEELSGVI